jgi:phosphatidate cytidylyltransferase
MKQRSISAIAIVLVSIVPALIGGPFFMLVFGAIMLVAFEELTRLLNIPDDFARACGYASIALAAVAAWAYADGRFLPGVLTVAVLLPLVSIVFRSSPVVDIRDWTTTVGATMYLVLPTFAAIALRGTEGTVRRDWFQDFSNSMPGNENTALGMGWFLLALLVTWLSDTCAYLVGKSVGRTKLIPNVSPNKTVEGAIGGLVAAGVTAVLCSLLFGLHIHPLTAILLGIVLGAVGMLGDLSESMLKRRAGVKDSGTRIPGHGGILDRVDALIFVLVATWALLPLFI